MRMVERRRPWLGRALASPALALLGGGAALLWAQATTAEALVADVSSHLIAITTGFTGSEVVLFGATDGPGDVVVMVTGPRGRVTVRRKERVGGVWVNRHTVTFDQVPSYYAVASSRPLEALLGASALARQGLDVDHLPLVAVGRSAGSEMAAVFRTALIAEKQRDGLYGRGDGLVVFLGERLFRTTLSFPANVATGAYNISVFQIRDHDVVSAQTTPLVVSKTGLGAEISEYAQRQPVLYGLAAVFGALVIGWGAGTALGRR